jgi:hypothetical protein
LFFLLKNFGLCRYEKEAFNLCGMSMSIISLVFSQPGVAETKADQVQQIYANYIEGAERWVCFGTPSTYPPVTFRQWSRPMQGDDELTLVVHSKKNRCWIVVRLVLLKVFAMQPLR